MVNCFLKFVSLTRGLVWIAELKELGRGVARMKEVMGRWEDKNIEDKEGRLVFGTEEGGKIRILGSWLGGEKDVSNRVKRVGGLWWKVRAKSKGSRLRRRWQAMIAEACVEGAKWQHTVESYNQHMIQDSYGNLSEQQPVKNPASPNQPIFFNEQEISDQNKTASAFCKQFTTIIPHRSDQRRATLDASY